MTELEIRAAHALVRCRYIPGTPAKRFARAMHTTAQTAPETELTEKQRAYVWGLVVRMRRQISDDLVQIARQMLAAPERPAEEIRVARQLTLL